MEDFVFGTLSTLDKRLAARARQHYGVRHLHRILPNPPRPDRHASLTVTTYVPFPVERVEARLLQPDTHTIAFLPGPTQWDLLAWQYGQVWEATFPPYPAGTVVRYTIHAYPAHGGDPVAADDGAIFSYRVEEGRPPAWAPAAIIYQIFPDRFHPGPGRDWPQLEDYNAIWGGALPGVTAQLDYLADLGVNCLWLNPFFPDESHHGYHATDYFSVNPRLGTEADIRQLVNEAHARGMRVLLDFVANHWGSGHPTFQEARRDPNSPYHTWYRWKAWPDAYETFFGVQDLPQVNVNDPGARAYLLQAARYWLEEIDFDGYRLDYAQGPGHDFWVDFRAVVKSVRPDAWIFGEVVEDPASQLSYTGRLDGCLDFLLAQKLRALFGLGSISLTAFDAFLNRHEAFFPATFSRPSFLDNHDIDRFLWLAQGDTRRLKLAALCQFTLAGPPIVYYGTEVGLSQRAAIHAPHSAGMAEARAPMPWDNTQDADLHQFYRWLIRFRRVHPALWRGLRRTLHLDEAAGTYAYVRLDDVETLVVAFNLSDHPRRLTLLGQSFDLSPWSGDVRPASA